VSESGWELLELLLLLLDFVGWFWASAKKPEPDTNARHKSPVMACGKIRETLTEEKDTIVFRRSHWSLGEQNDGTQPSKLPIL
jgi:hypothetical protein